MPGTPSTEVFADNLSGPDSRRSAVVKALGELKRTIEGGLESGRDEAADADKTAREERIVELIEGYVGGLEVLDLVDVCAGLAAELYAYWEERHSRTALTAWIELQREILDLCAAPHPQRAIVCSGLAKGLLLCYHHTGSSAALEEATALYREALKLRPVGHLDRAQSCINLGLAFKSSYDHTGDSALLDSATEYQQEALELCPPGHQYRDSACKYLAATLKARYKQTGDILLLDRVIGLQQEALALRPAGHRDRAISCNDLSASLWSRYRETSNIKFLYDAIKLEEEVLHMQPPEHPNYITSCESLAVSLECLYRHTKEGATLDKAISLFQEAMDLCPVGHLNRVRLCSNYAIALQTRHGETGEIALLHKAIELTEEVLPLSAGPAHWRYSFHLAELAQLLPSPVDWEVVLGCLNGVFRAHSYDNINDMLWQAVPMLADIDVSSMSHQHKQDLLTLHTTAMDVVTLAADFALDRSTQLQHANHGSVLCLAAFSLAADLNDLSSGLLLLERGRGIIWSHLFHKRHPQLDQIPAELAQRIQDLLRSANAPKRLTEQQDLATHQPAPFERNAHYKQRNQLHEIIRQIRTISGLGDFMRGPDIDVLLGLATQHPVVILVAEEKGCHALLISSGKQPLTHIPLPDITQKILQRISFDDIVSGIRGSPVNMNDAAGRGISLIKKSSFPPLARLEKLWHTTVKPIMEHLSLQKAQGSARPRIHWCPSGLFASVPLHAAGIYGARNQECCSDYVVSSYTPTLTALIQARQARSKFSTQELKLMTVAAKFAQDPDMPPLYHALPETREISNIAMNAGTSSCFNVAATATKAEVIAALQSSQVVHIACHGIQHEREPHKSHFCLSTGNLTVSELMEVNLQGAFLAFLSACESAKGDRKHTDEAVHLAAAMLSAGFRSVVATMWAMDDADGPYIARKFYQKLFEGPEIEISSVPYALDEAVTALRNKGVPATQWATFIHMGA